MSNTIKKGRFIKPNYAPYAEYDTIVVCYNCGYADTLGAFNHAFSTNECPKCKSGGYFLASEKDYKERFTK